MIFAVIVGSQNEARKYPALVRFMEIGDSFTEHRTRPIEGPSKKMFDMIDLFYQTTARILPPQSLDQVGDE